MYLNEYFKEAPNVLIEQLSCDSRLPMKNCIFFCMTGVKYDGHDYIEEAIENGASVIIHTKDTDTSLKAIFIKVKDINLTLAGIARLFYNNSLKDLNVHITCGCYGKSCVSSYINQLINDDEKTSSIGAYGIQYKDKNLTYPGSTLTLFDNFKYLSNISIEGCSSCCLEVDALSLSYNKLEGLRPSTFIYTNTSKFSKDYRGFSHKYFDSIRKYLYTLEEETKIILNRDDVSYNELISACSNNIVSYGFSKKATYVISNPYYYIDHTTFDLTVDNKTYNIYSPLITVQNIYNLTASIACLIENGYSFEFVLNNLSLLKAPEGIYENVYSDNKNVIVDYCYSLDSYAFIQDYVTSLDNYGKAYAVISCNADDDFAHLNAIYSNIKDVFDLVIFTEDMSYEKDIHDILANAAKIAKGNNFLTIEDREEAIKTAIDLMNNRDILFILGKGNGKFFYKNYQKILYEGDKEIALNYIGNTQQNI